MGIQSSGSNFSGGMITVEGQVMMAHSNPEVTKVFGLILKQFQGVYDEQGLNKRDILSNMTRMGNNINHHIFQEAVKSLTDQGYLYSTLDEDTYACSISF